MNWDFKVSGYKRGQLLCETVHRGVSSMEMEVDIWRERMKRNECDKIVVVDMRPLGKLTQVITE